MEGDYLEERQGGGRKFILVEEKGRWSKMGKVSFGLEGEIEGSRVASVKMEEQSDPTSASQGGRSRTSTVGIIWSISSRPGH